MFIDYDCIQHGRNKKIGLYTCQVDELGFIAYGCEFPYLLS